MTAGHEWSFAAVDLAPGATTKFRLEPDGRILDGFVVRVGDDYHAWLNRCPHVGAPLDLWPNEFLSDDGQLVVCSTHGAIFEPDTGACVGGPCLGDRLTRVSVRRDGDRVVVRAD